MTAHRLSAGEMTHPDPTTVTSRSHLVPLVWLACVGVVGVLTAVPGTPQLAQLTASMSAALFGVWVFWTHGGRRITAAGLYSLASAIFVGYAGLWWWWQPVQLPPGLLGATIAGFTVNVAMYALFWRKHLPGGIGSSLSSPVLQWGQWAGLIASLVGVLLGTAGVTFGTHAALSGLALLTVSLMLHVLGRGYLYTSLLIAFGGVVVYWTTVFTGYGRLTVASLGIVALVLASVWAKNHMVKAGVLLALFPVMIFLVQSRSQLGVQMIRRESDGLGSVVNPLRTFGQLVLAQESGSVPYAHGRSFIATALFWIPRDIWPGKPPGLGSDLTAILAPEYLQTGHSMAAHIYGEWYYNFGWLGVVAMVPVIGYAIRWLDGVFARVLVADVDSRRQLLKVVIVLLLVADVPTLMWAGSFTYVARAGQRILFLALLVMLFASQRLRLKNPAKTYVGE